jgi:hypothetical protein
MVSDLVLYDNDELAIVDTGWVIRSDCPLLMDATREHTEEDYEIQLKRLKLIENASPFWLGYIANKGKEEIGRGALSDIAHKNGYDDVYIRNTAYVYRQYDPSETSLISDIYNDYPDLPWGVYQVCAPLETEEEKLKWLRYAGEHKLSAPKLRQAMKGEGFQPKSFNIWSAFPIEEWQQEYPGQIPGGILQNVLYYTTHKGDLVIDPFGGGGNMGLACERMGRTCIAYDIAPQFPNIKKHNVVFPFPDNDAQLVFLDPPYWGQKHGEYAPDPADLSNIEDAGQFHLLLKSVIDNAKEALLPGGYCVLIIGASQTKDYYIDHAAEMYSMLRTEWKHINSVAAAYPTTQYSGNDMNHAKENHIMLNLYTTIQFWQKI